MGGSSIEGFSCPRGRCCPPLRYACSSPPMLFPFLSCPGALMNNYWGWVTFHPLPSLCLRPSSPGPSMDIIRPADQIPAACDNGAAVSSVSRWTRLSAPAWWTVIHLQGKHAAFFCYCRGFPSVSSSAGRLQGPTKESGPEECGRGCCTWVVVVMWKRNTDNYVVFKSIIVSSKKRKKKVVGRCLFVFFLAKPKPHFKIYNFCYDMQKESSINK